MSSRPAATSRSPSTSTKSTATTSSTTSTACSRSPSGTRPGDGCCWPATGWARSRCCGRRPAPGRLVFGSEPRALLADPDVPRTLDLDALDATLATQYVPPDRTPWGHCGRAAGGPPGLGGRRRRAARRRLVAARLPAQAPRDAGGCRGRAATAAARSGRPTAGGRGARWVRSCRAGLTRRRSSRRWRRPMPAACGRSRRASRRPATTKGRSPAPWPRTAARSTPSSTSGRSTRTTLLDLVRRVGHPAGRSGGRPGVPARGPGRGARDRRADRRRGRRAPRRIPAPSPAGVDAAGAAAARGGASRAPSLPGLVPKAQRVADLAALDPDHRYAALFRHFSDADRRRLYGERLRPLLEDGRPLRAVEEAWAAGCGADVDGSAAGLDQGAYLAGDLLREGRPHVDGPRPRAAVAAAGPGDRASGRRGSPPGSSGAAAPASSCSRPRRPWLPETIPGGPKQGFAVPVGAWLRGPLCELAHDVLLDRRTADRGLIDRGETV